MHLKRGDVDYYEKLSRDVETGTVVPDASRLTRNPKAGERFLLDAAVVDTWEEFERVEMGRPRAGQGRGPPVIQTRIPHALKEQLDIYATNHGQEGQRSRARGPDLLVARSLSTQRLTPRAAVTNLSLNYPPQKGHPMDNIEFPCQLEIPEGTFEITPDDRGFPDVFKVHETVPAEQIEWGYAQPERGRLMFRIVVDPRKGLDPVSEAMTQLEKKLAAPKDLDMVETDRWRYRKINQICAETAEYERLATRLTDAEQEAAHLAKEGQPMPKHPFEALQDHHLKWVAQGIGSDHGTLVGDSHSPFLHPGDDVGRAAAVAFEKYSPAVAADVLRCYRTAYNRAIMAANASQAASDAAATQSEEELHETCGLALSVRLNGEQIEAVKKSLSDSLETQ